VSSTSDSPAAFERCIEAGGVAVFPSDTVYGLACSPFDPAAVERLYALKGRPVSKASAVMFFDLSAALAALPSLAEATRAALSRLLPGAVTVLLPNPERLFPLACGEDPLTLGLRVISVPALAGVSVPVLQSSANLAGGPEARRLAEVDPTVLAGVDLAIDGGILPGVASTVLDLRRFEDGGVDGYRVLRAGAVGAAEIAGALAGANSRTGQFHFNPGSYLELIRNDIPVYDAFQEAVVAASGSEVDAIDSILELGTGTGETARRLLARHRGAVLVGVDESSSMLDVARAALGGNGRGAGGAGRAPGGVGRVSLRVARLQDPLPDGPFRLVASALCVHHLTGPEKADLFVRVRAALAPGGRFVLGDVIVPVDPADASTALTPGYDKPDTVADQLGWLTAAGFHAEVVWEHGDLAVIAADAAG
jgi:tRNA threonylcarbamoyl adenosine modification protein (Sua5/YciO/YrdC/YwlC family)